jgi:hypothetical protein
MNIPKNTDKNGRDKLGKFTTGNHGKPKGATNKTTRDLRKFIVNFLNEKSYEITHIWDTLEDKDKLTLFMHLCRLVMPKPNDTTDLAMNVELYNNLDLSHISTEDLERLLNEQEPTEQPLTPAQIDRLIDKL